MLPPRDVTSLNQTFRLPSGHFGLLTPLNQQVKKGVTMLAGVTDPDNQGEIGLLLHNGGKEEFLPNTGDSLGNLSVTMPCDYGQWKT